MMTVSLDYVSEENSISYAFHVTGMTPSHFDKCLFKF